MLEAPVLPAPEAIPAADRAAAVAPPVDTPADTRAIEPTPAAPGADTTPTAPPGAIIYVPSVGETVDADAVDGFARRVARALDYQDRNPEVSYSVRAAAPATYGQSNSTAEVREILVTESGKEPVVAHRVYHLGYHPLLEEKKRANALLQIFDLVYLCFVLALRYFVAVRRKSLGATQKITLFVGGFWLAIMLVYAATTIGVIVNAAAPDVTKSVGEAYHDAKARLRAKFPEATAVVADYTRPLRQYAVHLLVALGSLGLTVTAVREALDRSGRNFMRFGRYLMLGEGRACCTGQFNALLEHVVTQKPGRIDVVGYSMGSLIVLDALYPGAGLKPSRANRIATISTIGCPFDLVRTLWPNYFSNRSAEGPAIPWFNVYSPVDLLGSNFRNDTNVHPDPTHGINYADPRSAASRDEAKSFSPRQNLFYDHANRTDLDVIDAVLLRGFLAHGQYWVPDNYEAESCFTRLVPMIYQSELSDLRAAVINSTPNE